MPARRLRCSCGMMAVPFMTMCPVWARVRATIIAGCSRESGGGCLLQGGWAQNSPSPRPAEGDGQWALATTAAAGTEMFYHSRWHPQGNGADLWQSFSRDGALANVDDPTPAAAGEQLGGAIASRFYPGPGGNPPDSLRPQLGPASDGVCHWRHGPSPLH
nr:GH116 family glycosyl-hydrolase [Halomicronema hongdechloris]